MGRRSRSPVTHWIDDPLLGPLAPGPQASLSGCHSRRESASVDNEGPGPGPGPQPELPSPARQRELDAEALEQIEFDRRENAWKEENNRIRVDNYRIRYELMCPEAQLAEDLRRVELHAAHNGFDVPLGPHPRLGIMEQPF